MIKIHDKLWYIKTNRTHSDENLAYMTYYEQNTAFDKRKDTGLSWSQSKEDAAVVIDNIPRKGFVITDSVSRWSTQNKLFRVTDPAGFVVEVPTGNISTLLKYTTVINGEIQEECVWGREGNNHILLPKGSEPYNLAKEQTEETNAAVTLGRLEIGNTIKFTTEGSEYIYLGKWKYVWNIEKRRAFKLESYSSWYSSKYTASQSDPVTDTITFTEDKWRHVFYPMDDSKDYNQRYERKSSGKVIVTGKVEIDVSKHPDIKYTSHYDSYKDLDDFLEENELVLWNWRNNSPDYVTKSVKGIIRK